MDSGWAKIFPYTGEKSTNPNSHDLQRYQFFLHKTIVSIRKVFSNLFSSSGSIISVSYCISLNVSIKV